MRPRAPPRPCEHGPAAQSQRAPSARPPRALPSLTRGCGAALGTAAHPLLTVMGFPPPPQEKTGTQELGSV